MSVETRIVDLPFVYGIEAVRTRRRSPERIEVLASVPVPIRIVPEGSVETIRLPFGRTVDGCFVDGRLHVRDPREIRLRDGGRSSFGVEAVRMFDAVDAAGVDPASVRPRANVLGWFLGTLAPEASRPVPATDPGGLRDVLRDGRAEAEAEVAADAAGFVLCGGEILSSWHEPVFHPVPHEGRARMFDHVMEDVRRRLHGVRFRPNTVSIAAAAVLDPSGDEPDPRLSHAAPRHDPMARSILHFLEVLDGFGEAVPYQIVGAATAGLRSSVLPVLEGGSVPDGDWRHLTEAMEDVARILAETAGHGGTEPLPKGFEGALRVMRNVADFRREVAAAEAVARGRPDPSPGEASSLRPGPVGWAGRRTG